MLCCCIKRRGSLFRWLGSMHRQAHRAEAAGQGPPSFCGGSMCFLPSWAGHCDLPGIPSHTTGLIANPSLPTADPLVTAVSVVGGAGAKRSDRHGWGVHGVPCTVLSG